MFGFLLPCCLPDDTLQKKTLIPTTIVEDIKETEEIKEIELPDEIENNSEIHLEVANENAPRQPNMVHEYPPKPVYIHNGPGFALIRFRKQTSKSGNLVYLISLIRPQKAINEVVDYGTLYELPTNTGVLFDIIPAMIFCNNKQSISELQYRSVGKDKDYDDDVTTTLQSQTGIEALKMDVILKSKKDSALYSDSLSSENEELAYCILDNTGHFYFTSERYMNTLYERRNSTITKAVDYFRKQYYNLREIEYGSLVKVQTDYTTKKKKNLYKASALSSDYETNDITETSIISTKPLVYR